MVENVRSMFINYAKFSGRISRRDFWMTILGYIIFSFVIGFISGFIGGLLDMKNLSSITAVMFVLATIVPLLALYVRRLHDINKSGLWLLIDFIPFVGGIILIVFLCLPSVNENNNY